MEKRPFWRSTVIILLVPIVGLAAGVAVTLIFDINQIYRDLIINLFFLMAVMGLISYFKPSRKALGLQVLSGQMGRHVVLSLLILGLYLLFYIFVIRISTLNPLTTAVWWGLLTNLFVVLAEELYFRGLLYGFIQKRFSARTALLITSLIFGLFHAQQGIRGIVTKLFTGWLWGSVRYASGMIFLIIFPIHYAFNTIWLLFMGNWNNPPAWGIVTLPIIEFGLGLVFVTIRARQSEKVTR